MNRLVLLSLPWILAGCGGSDSESDAAQDPGQDLTDMDSVEADSALDIERCPPPPDCPEGQVPGQYRLTDPEGCPSYCCTGADAEFSNVSVSSSNVVELSATVSITGVGGSVRLDLVSAELRSESDGSGIGNCDGVDLSGESPYSPIDFTLGCTLTAPEPCGENVEVLFGYSWHDGVCMASDHDTRSVGALYDCTGP